MQPFRFLHAADFHLEQPLAGLSKIPDSLRESAVDAPLLAAQNVFDAAVDNEVDFLVLAGDVLNPIAAGPRAITFLLEQFERLLEEQIGVYWLAGEVDHPGRWPAAAKLPENVHCFTPQIVERITHYRDEEPLARLIGFSGIDPQRIRPSDVLSGDADFTLGVAYGLADSEKLSTTDVRYWAMGGQHESATNELDGKIIQYAGTTQGRTIKETGVHGCTLVTVDVNGQPSTKQIATDLIRWHQEEIDAEQDATPAQVYEVMSERMLNLSVEADGRALLVQFRVTGLHQFGKHRGFRGVADAWKQQLRSDFADHSPVAWTDRVEIDPPAKLPSSWRKEKTLLGDFLQEIDELRADPSEPLELVQFLSDELLHNLSDTVRLTDPNRRREVLREAAMLGVELLRGDEC